MPSDRPRSLLALLVASAALALAAAPATAAIYPGDAVLGPTSALQSLGGIDLAPDGSGALVATVQDGGVDHVVVSRLVNGAWSGPERVDGALAGPSAQPVAAAADGGRVVVAFVNGGNVYAVTRASAAAGYGAPQAVWAGGGASSPALDLSVNGKQYLAFTAPGTGGHDVRAAFAANGGPWTLAGAPLDGDANADAGAGAGRSRVGASADGTAVVVWGEGGHVLARRVRGTQPSVVFADASADLSIEGVPAASADEPVVGVQDDDSFTGVAFRATFVVGGTPRSRVVYRRLRGSRFEGPTAVDALPFSSGQGSVNPQIATIGTGQGIVLGSSDAGTFFSYAMLLHGDVGPGTVSQVDSIAPSSAPTSAVTAAATALKMLVAWQLTPTAGAAEIHARYYDGTIFEAEQLLSRPELGPTDAAAGLAASGDDEGDLAVAYVQDVPGQGPIVAVAAVDQPPGRFSVARRAGFERTLRPLLFWTTSREAWGRYFRVTVDGVQVGVTGRRSLRTPPLGQGVHRWQVTALDRRGQQYVAPAGTVRIDTVPALVQTTLAGARRSGASLRLTVRARDAPPPTAAGARPIRTSGVRSVFVDWGDHVRQLIVRGTRHVYRRPGHYLVRVVVTDRAGNRATVRRVLRIVKPRKHRKPKHGHGRPRKATAR